MSIDYLKYLSGTDLRSISKVNQLVPLINTQKQFDKLMTFVFSKNRHHAMRAIDAVEKITIHNPGYLHKHKKKIIDLMFKAKHKEMKWHLALIVARLDLTEMELGRVWNKIAEWARSTKESKIVRVNSLEAMHCLAARNKRFAPELNDTFEKVKGENIPSIDARVKKLELKQLKS